MADKVVVKANRASRESQIDEGIASEAITPGALVELGGSDDYQNHSTANGAAMNYFALEPLDKSKDIEDDTPSGDSMEVFKAHAGDRLHALLFAGENISKGDWLESNGDGTLVKVTPGTSDTSEKIVAKAVEDLDNSGSSSSARIKIEVV